MSDDVKFVECPRDAWQGLKGHIPVEIKVNYLRALITAGFTHIDAVSFVSPKAVPQMTDSEQVLEQLQPPEDVEIIGIVANGKGAERAIHTSAVRTLGFPYSVSPTFLERNQNQTIEQAYDELERIKQKADEAGLDMAVYISMAFGNPYGDLWSPDEVVEAVGLIEEMDIHTISLADTVGAATPEQVAEVFAAVNGKFGYLEVGCHLHSRPAETVEKVLAAYDAGCRRFDSALGGLGGCPFAQDALVSNLATESVLKALAQRGVEPPVTLGNLVHLAAEISARYGKTFAAD